MLPESVSLSVILHFQRDMWHYMCSCVIIATRALTVPGSLPRLPRITMTAVSYTHLTLPTICSV